MAMTVRGNMATEVVIQGEPSDEPRISTHCSNDTVPCAHYMMKAESLLEEGKLELAEEQLKQFFKTNEASNHFLARAYICKAIVAAPADTSDVDKLEECTEFITKVVNMCKKTPSYHFLVFNASVVLWRLVRPFQTSGHRRPLVQVLLTVSRALEDIGDGDELWRMEILVALLHGQLESGQSEDASKTCNKVLQLARKCARHRLPDFLRLLVVNGLSESKESKEDVKADPQLYLLYKVIKLRSTSSTLGDSDLQDKLEKLLSVVLMERERSGATSGRKRREAQKGAVLTDSPAITQEMRSPSLVELAELCLLHSKTAVASKCMQHFSPDKQSSNVVLRAELVECQLELAALKDAVFTRSAVERRQSVLARYCAVLSSAHRLRLSSLVEAAAVLLWNAALPLLQHNLRAGLVTPLSQMTLYTELQDSLLHQLRCEAHFELAKCLEEAEKTALALEHVDKALKLDGARRYCSGLLEKKRSLLLGSQLYHLPETPLDQATSLLEQGKTTTLAGPGEASRALLVKIGALLDPRFFEKALAQPSSELEGSQPASSSTSSSSSGDFEDHLLFLSSKCAAYGRMRTAPVLHKEQCSEEDAKERCRLWGQLTQMSRRLEVWDVSLLASKYCLIYNDGRWGFLAAAHKLKGESLAVPSKTGATDSSMLDGSPSSITASKDQVAASKEGAPGLKDSVSALPREGTRTPSRGNNSPKQQQRSQKSVLQDSSGCSTTTTSSRPPAAGDLDPRAGRLRPCAGDREMLRLLASAACLQGEALVHLVRSEGLDLFCPPTPPPSARHVRDFDPDTNPSWRQYSEWIQALSVEAVGVFLQSAELAVQLRETWILHNAVVYLWNYTLHLVGGAGAGAGPGPRAEPMVDPYLALLGLARQLPDYKQPSVLCGVSGVLVRGAVQRWRPVLLEALQRPPETPALPGKKQDKGKSKGPPPLLSQVDPAAETQLKEALKICEECLKESPCLPLPHRQPLLASWVHLKTLLQQSVDKTLGQGSESDSVAHQNSVVVGLEMLKTRGGPFADFTYYPTIKELMDHLSSAVVAGGEDFTVGLELWAGLSEAAWKAKDFKNAELCAEKGVEVGPAAVDQVLVEAGQRKAKDYGLTPASCRQMLSLVLSIKGGCLAAKATTDVGLIKETKHCLLRAARYAQEAGSYPHLMQACRLVWNMCCPACSTPQGRGSLVTLLLELLDLLALLSSRRRKSVGPVAEDGGAVGTAEDFALRVNMYCVLLQSYFDKGDWLGGLTLCEKAVQVLPRAHHMPLIRHRIVLKCKLGRSVEADMAVFAEDSEENLAGVWSTVARHAVTTKDKMAAYRKAIDTITLTANGWRKVDYLLEYGKWLHSTHHSKATTLAQFQDALQLIMCLRTPPTPPPSSPSSSPVEENKSNPSATSRSERTGTANRAATNRSTAVPSVVEQDGTKRKSSLGLAAGRADEIAEENPDAIPLGSPPTRLSDLRPQPLSSIQSVPHLLRVVYVFVNMGVVEGRGSRGWAGHCRTALDITFILWKSSLKGSSPLPPAAVKQAKPGDSPLKSDQKGLLQAIPSGRDGRKSSTIPRQDGVRPSPSPSSSPSSALPHTALGWATLTLSDETKTAIQDSQDVNTINRSTVSSPGLTLHYLQCLAESLSHSSLLPSALPVLALQLVIAEHILQSTTHTVLVRMRMVALCRELRLGSAVAHHSDLLPPSYYLLPEDVARSEAEMLSTVVHEEATAKELRRWESVRTAKTISQHTVKTTSSSSFQTALQQSAAGAGTGPAAVEPEVGDQPCLRRVWLEQARMMVPEGCYNAIQKMLQAVCKSAKSCGDGPTLCGALLCLAQLDLREKQWSRASEHLQQAQSLPCGLEDSLASLLLQCDLLRSQHLPLGVVVGAGVGLFTRLGRQQAANRAFAEYAVDALNFRLHLSRLDHSPLQLEPLLALVNGMERRGREAGAARMMAQCAEVLQQCLAQLDPSSPDCHALQLKIVDWCQDLISRLRRRVIFIEDNSPDFTLEGVSLPEVRGLAGAQLVLAAVLVGAGEEHVLQERTRSLQARTRPSVERMIDEFVGQQEEMSTEEQRWNTVARLSSDHALPLLSSCHDLFSSDHFTLAQVHLLTGKCLLSVANSFNNDISVQWDSSLYEALESLSAEEGEGGEEGEEALTSHVVAVKKDYSTVSMVMRSEDAKRDQTEEILYQHHLTKATHSLGQAIALGLRRQHLEVVCSASLLLTDCLGLLDSCSAVQYLALHQSCALACQLSRQIRALHPSPASSQLAATLRERELSHPDRHLPAFALDTPSVDSIPSLSNLSVPEDHLSIIRNFPSNVRVVLLQHSLTRDKLYGGYMLPPQPPAPAAAKKTPSTAPSQVPVLPEPVVSRCAVSAATLDSILALLAEQRADRRGGADRAERRRGRSRNRQQDLAAPNICSSSEAPPPSCPAPPLPENASPLTDVLAAMEAYLSEALQLIDVAIRREKNAKLTFVILADSHLMQLPLEALSIFTHPCVSAVSRDFSLSLLHHKLTKFNSCSAVDVDGDKQQVKTPGKKDKGDKFKVQPETILVSCATAKYLLDVDRSLSHYNQKAYKELGGQVLAEVLAHSKHTSKWSGLNRPEHSPSDGELTELLASADGLIYLDESGLSKWMDLTTANLSQCSLGVFLATRPGPSPCHTPSPHALLPPILEAQLLSLGGVASFLTAQWQTEVKRTAEVYQHFMRGLFAESKTVSSAYWDMVNMNHPIEQDQEEKHQQQQQQQRQQSVDGVVVSTDADGDAVAMAKEVPTLLDPSQAYCYVLYGLPHINFNSPI